jgi:hypothetical protein
MRKLHLWGHNSANGGLKTSGFAIFSAVEHGANFLLPFADSGYFQATEWQIEAR